MHGFQQSGQQDQLLWCLFQATKQQTNDYLFAEMTSMAQFYLNV